MFPSTDPVRCYSSVTQQWKLQTASCWQSSATVGYCWWSNNELRRLLVAINCTSVFLGWCLQRLNDSISGWLMDRAKNWTTKLRQLLIQSSRYCAARLQLLSLHDQSDTPVSSVWRLPVTFWRQPLRAPRTLLQTDWCSLTDSFIHCNH